MDYLTTRGSGLYAGNRNNESGGSPLLNPEARQERLGHLTSGRPTNRRASDFAANTRAWINREIYNDYQNRFLPHEQELLDAITGTELLNERLSTIRINEDNAFEASAQNANRRLARYGVNQSNRERRALDTNTNLARSSAIASAENSTRQHVHDRNMALISGAPSRQAIQVNQ